jgi:hypothetical protein
MGEEIGQGNGTGKRKEEGEGGGEGRGEGKGEGKGKRGGIRNPPSATAPAAAVPGFMVTSETCCMLSGKRGVVFVLDGEPLGTRAQAQQAAS